MTSHQQFEQWFATVHESGSYANSHLFERVVSDTRYCSMEVEYAWLAYEKNAQDAERYRKLRRWMSSNVQEGWREVENMAALCCYMSWEEADQYLDDLPVCNVGLCYVREEPK